MQNLSTLLTTFDGVKKLQSHDDRTVNGSLTDSDVWNRQKIILKEAKEVTQVECRRT